jgi:hypothetical protein
MATSKGKRGPEVDQRGHQPGVQKGHQPGSTQVVVVHPPQGGTGVVSSSNGNGGKK